VIYLKVENNIFKYFMIKIKELLYSKNLNFSILVLSIIISFFSEKMIAKADVEHNLLYSDDNLNGYDLSCDNLPEEELKDITSINYIVRDDDSFEWIKYFPNIQELTIIFDTSDKSLLKDIHKIKNLEKLESLHLITADNISMSEKDFSFLHDCSELKSLEINGLSVEKGVLESLDNLEKLSINSFCQVSNTIDTDYSKLTFLKELNFDNSKPYNISIFFSSDDYKILTANGVDITSLVDGCIDKVIDINEKLDYIVQQLDIDSNDKDIDKFNKIILYILDKLDYDEEFILANLDTQNGSKNLIKKFYNEGLLYGALNGDNAICGNYAALFTALAKRVGLNSYYLCNSKHAWNLVEINGDNYYTDITWLDDETLLIDYYGFNYSKTLSAQDIINDNLTEYLKWYMVDPTDFTFIDQNNNHVADNIPSYVEIVPINNNHGSTTTTSNLDTKDYEFITDKLIIGSSFAFLGSIVVHLNRKKKRKAIFNKYRNMIRNHEGIDKVYTKKRFDS